MKKFNIKHPQKAFTLYNKSRDWLFKIGWGHDICIFKKGSDRKHFCQQWSFNYEGIKTPLCGKEGEDNPFELKRFTVIQMK